LIVTMLASAACTTAQPPPPPPLPDDVFALYVSPDGDDADPGTREEPFATVERARDVLRGRNGQMDENVIVYLRGGTYPRTDPFVLESQDSGTNGFTITYAAYPGERPVISGGVRIDGWQVVDGANNIWRADVGTHLRTRQFYVNGSKAQRARGIEDPNAFSLSDGGFTAAHEAMAGWGNQQDIELVGLNEWKIFRCRVDQISGRNVRLVEPCWRNGQQSDPPFNRVFWVENAYELLDSEGEWYLDRSAGALFYKPRHGEDISTVDAVAAGAESLLQAWEVSGVRFSGLTFAYAGWNLPSTDLGYIGLQTGVYPADGSWDGEKPEAMTPAAVQFHGARDVVLESNVFAHLGAGGVSLDGGSQQITVNGSRFEDVGSNGINLGTFDDFDAEPEQQNRGFVVSNNYLTGTGSEYANSAAIWGGYVADAQIVHNEIFGVPQKGIAIGWGWGLESYAANNRISYNHVHEFTKVLFDSGGIYTLSPQPDTEISFNFVDHDVNGLNCLYPDEGTESTVWHSNVCSRVGEWLHIWTSTIRENEVRGNFSDTSSMEDEGEDNTISGNTVVEDGQWPPEAQAIIDGAGIKDEYVGIKNIPLVP
jgi:hypothetical protein